VTAQHGSGKPVGERLPQAGQHVAATDEPELRLELRLAAARLRRKAAISRGCVIECGYTV